MCFVRVSPERPDCTGRNSVSHTSTWYGKRPCSSSMTVKFVISSGKDKGSRILLFFFDAAANILIWWSVELLFWVPFGDKLSTTDTAYRLIQWLTAGRQATESAIETSMTPSRPTGVAFPMVFFVRIIHEPEDALGKTYMWYQNGSHQFWRTQKSGQSCRLSKQHPDLVEQEYSTFSKSSDWFLL